MSEIKYVGEALPITPRGWCDQTAERLITLRGAIAADDIQPACRALSALYALVADPPPGVEPFRVARVRVSLARAATAVV